jgi:uncharacterized protein (TIGR02268 family)
MVSSLLLVLALTAKTPHKQTHAQRELKTRAMVVNDASVQQIRELHVQGGTPTTLVFDQPLKEPGVQLLDEQEAFYPPSQTARTVVLVPHKDLGPDAVMVLTVTLADGTPLPFRLTTADKDADLQVTVNIALEKKGNENTPAKLQALNAALQGQLEECQSSVGDTGIKKIGDLILAQHLDRPAAFSVERLDLHWRDKQSRLVVTVTQAYRLFEHTYLVLHVQNRDTSSWVLEKATVKLAGGSESADVRVVDARPELSSLPSNQEENVVVIFNTPPQQKKQSFDIDLLEKNGNRHVEIRGLDL